jgi:hypothetical protein
MEMRPGTEGAIPSYIERRRQAEEADRIVGQRVKELRKLAGLSQTALADAAGVTFQQFRNTRRASTGSGQSAWFESQLPLVFRKRT